MTQDESLLPEFIPASLAEEGVVYSFAMAQLRPRNIAWKKDAAIRIIAMLADHGYAILGGDVLEPLGEQLAYSGEYWDLPDEDVVLWEEYVGYTKERSIAFITDVAGRKGEHLLYTLFFVDERRYKRQLRDFGSVKYR